MILTTASKSNSPNESITTKLKSLSKLELQIQNKKRNSSKKNRPRNLAHMLSSKS